MTIALTNNPAGSPDVMRAAPPEVSGAFVTNVGDGVCCLLKQLALEALYLVTGM